MFQKRFQKNRPAWQTGNFSRQRPQRKIKHIDARLFVQKAQEVQEDVYTPTHLFTDFAVHPQLKANIVERGYTTPSPIQDQIIPHILDGKDVVGIANTGTGKTAAFLIPLIDKLIKNRQEKMLIVAPTRELAVQIEDEFLLFSKSLMLSSVICIGGANMRRQVMAIRKRPNVVIGTPGRLKDLINRRDLHIHDFKTVVLDEVDKMMDMGFIQDIKFLISHLSKDRQSLFFSATISPQVAPLMQQFLKNPVSVSVKKQETAKNVDQDIIRVNGRNKVDLLHDLLIQKEFSRVLIFARTKRGVDKLGKSLHERGFNLMAIHGNKSQNQRQKALDLFKQGKLQLLLATDVAARGLDIQDVSHVINFDTPESYEDYIHRIGRTGRANKKGVALTFVD